MAGRRPSPSFPAPNGHGRRALPYPFSKKNMRSLDRILLFKLHKFMTKSLPPAWVGGRLCTPFQKLLSNFAIQTFVYLPAAEASMIGLKPI